MEINYCLPVFLIGSLFSIIVTFITSFSLSFPLSSIHLSNTSLFESLKSTSVSENNLPVENELDMINKETEENIEFSRSDDSHMKRIINLGMPKTGTTSLHGQLKHLLGGSATSHQTDCISFIPFSGVKTRCERPNMCGRIFYESEKDKTHTLLSHLKINNRLFAQLDCFSFKHFWVPQIISAERLFKESENRTIFVLTTRETDKWLSSVHRWTNLEQRIMSHLRNNVCEPFGISFNETLSNQQILTQFFKWHEERIINLAKEYNEELFILNLSHPEYLENNFSLMYTKLTGLELNLTSYEWDNKQVKKSKNALKMTNVSHN